MVNDGDFEDVGRKNPSPGVHIRLGQSNIVLLNIATKDRLSWLAQPEVHRLLHETWRQSTGWIVGEYLLMPDHLHAFCAPRDLQFTIEEWIKYWKREFAIKHGQKEWKFQAGGWHHRLRGGESFSQKWLYVQENPVRKGLVTDLHQWPYKGKVFDLPWHD